MDNYIAAIFDTKEAAVALHSALLQLHHNGVRVKRAGVYGRALDGDVELVDTDTNLEGVFETLTGSLAGEEEALDELSEKLPAGFYALLAHVEEDDPAVIDDMVGQCGGTVYRRGRDELESTGFDRFIDSTSL